MGVQDFFRHLMWAVALVALQVLFFNHLCFLGVAKPIVYVYILCLLPQNMSRNGWLMWGFATGLCVDVFSELPGLGAASMTFAAMLAPRLMTLFATREALEERRWVLSLSESSGLRYAFTLVLIHHAVYVILEMFSFHHPLYMFYAWSSSSLLTFFVIWALSRINIVTVQQHK